jgi:glycosyltransferase involved in cell wall biosynthesis
LVGVPCYKGGSMVDRCLRSLEEPGVQLLIVDNGSTSDVKQVISGRGIVIHNDVNRYVNPAWNQMMRFFLDHQGSYDLLVIANSDLVLDSGWSAKLREHRQANRHEQTIFGIDTRRQRRSAGAFFAMTRSAVAASCPIPDDLLVFGGDDFIFYVSIGIGCREHVVPSITMTHVERGTYDKSPEVWNIAQRDTDRWIARGLEEWVPGRIKKYLSHKTPRSLYKHVRALYRTHLDGCSTCDRNEDCAACGSGRDGGHACNCHQEGGGLGYRLRMLYKETRRGRKA